MTNVRRTTTIGLLALLATLPPGAGAVEASGSLTLAPESRSDNTASPYFVGPPVVPPRHRAMRQDLGLRVQDGGFNMQGTFRVLATEGRQPEWHGIVNQLYYDGEAGAGQGWTVGRKVMTWGVGFGFRPLDVVQREDRRGLNPPPLVGIPVLAWETIAADDALTVVWQRPGSGRGATAAEDQAIAVHWYRLAGGADLHAVARLSRRNGAELGVGAGRTLDDEWSLHAAALNQGRYEKRLNRLAETGGLLATSDPTVVETRRNAVKAVGGAQWTGASGFGVLLEAWYDGEAWSRAEWQRLDRLTARQHALAGLAPRSAIDGNVAWSSQAFDRPNLLRENLMARLSYDGDQRWKTSLEWVTTPRDRGRVVTASVAHEGNRQRVAGGLRWLGGPADSAYGQAPLRRAAWLEWRLALP